MDLANLTNTDLAGANVSGVDLNRANLKGAKLKSVVGFELKSSNIKSTNSNLMVEERPTTIQTEASPSTDNNKTIALDKNKFERNKNVNILSLFLLGLVASGITGIYIYLSRNSDFSWQQVVQKLQPWKQQVEQLAPAN